MSVKKSSRTTVGISIAAVGLLAAGILIARQPASDNDAAMTQEMSAHAEPAKKAPARRAAAPARKPAAAKSSATAAAAKTTTPTAEPAPLAASAPVKAEATTKAATADAAVTIIGCLERADDVYRLKDTEGENAPKSRSWKSGFLRRGSTKVDIVDASNRLRLENHVGHRISVTGALKDKQIQARSLQHLSPSCD